MKPHTTKDTMVDLTNDDASSSPDWHREALEDAKLAIANGTATFCDWEDAKERILHEAKRKA